MASGRCGQTGGVTDLTPSPNSPPNAGPASSAAPEDTAGVPADELEEKGGLPRTLVGISFGDEFRAREFLTASTRMAAQGNFTLEDAVLVVKAADGSTVVQETTDPQPARSALSGAVWAGLFGLILGGPVGWIAGTAVGAGAGAVTAKIVDLGISDEWVGWFREAVQPGTATVALLVGELDNEALITEARRFTGAELVYANLDEVTLGRIRAALSTG